MKTHIMFAFTLTSCLGVLFLVSTNFSCSSAKKEGGEISGPDPDIVSQELLDSLHPQDEGKKEDGEIGPKNNPSDITGEDIKEQDDLVEQADHTILDLDSIETPDGETQDIEPEVPFGEGIQFLSPNNLETVTGSILVKLAPLKQEEWIVDTVKVMAGAKEIFHDSKLPTWFVLDTRQYDNGSLVLTAVAKYGSMESSDDVKIVISNPDFAFKKIYPEKLVYKNGEEITIDVSLGKPGLQVSADFSSLDSNFVSTNVSVYALAAGNYRITYSISPNNGKPDGIYPVKITAKDGNSVIENSALMLTLRKTPEIPIRVQGGIFVPGTMPQPTPEFGDAISLVSGNEFIITGGTATLDVDFSDYDFPSEIIGIIVAVEGFSGYYQYPLEQSSGDEELLLLMRVYVNEQPPATLPVKIALRDATGRISNYKTHNLEVKAVGSGDVQVSVSWDTPTDVDLHVVEPGGCEIYYGHDLCAGSGGQLDLDSNAACDLDYVNNENVFWPEGAAPSGTYIVRVDFWEDCCSCGANYTVTIHYCGDIEVYNGSFAPNTDDMGGEGSGVEVATFNNENCGRILRGRIRYQDRLFDRWGFSVLTWKPARYVTLELRRASDSQLLATGFTDRFGRYEIQFANEGPPGIYLNIVSKTNYEEGLPRVAVMNHPKFKKLYSVPTPSVDESVHEFPTIDFDIPEQVGAGAFNILDVVTQGYDMVRLMTGKDLGELSVYWATGADTTDTIYCNQYFYDQGICTELGALSVQGKDIDRDEYDDMVILREFFKFALDKVSRDDSPGGPHNGTRDIPTRAWTEGVSTFFACDVLNYPFFINSKPYGVYLIQDVEKMDSPFAYKTANGQMSGFVSEYLVAAVLWDLADGVNSEDPYDDVEFMANAVYDSVINYLGSQTKFQDRGFEGVDFVDFLDGWFCRGYGMEGAVSHIVLDERKFPYDFNGLADCTH